LACAKRRKRVDQGKKGRPFQFRSAGRTGKRKILPFSFSEKKKKRRKKIAARRKKERRRPFGKSSEGYGRKNFWKKGKKALCIEIKGGGKTVASPP